MHGFPARRAMTFAACVTLAAVAVGCAKDNAPASTPVETTAIAAPAAAAPTAVAAPAARVIHPDASRVFKAASAKLASLGQFSYVADVWDDTPLGDAHNVTTLKHMTIAVRRPNKLRVDIASPRRDRQIVYDGSTLTLLDKRGNVYGTTQAPATLDELFDAAQDTYGITIPLDDLLLSDPYTEAAATIQSGAYFGKVNVQGVECEHVAFSSPVVDWQLWVDASGLPRRVNIAYKLEPTWPQFTAILSDWKTDASIPDADFVFTPPAGAVKADMVRKTAE